MGEPRDGPGEAGQVEGGARLRTARLANRSGPRSRQPARGRDQGPVGVGMDYPRIAADLAAQTDDLFFGGFGVLLDYSPASILALDAFFADLYGLQGDSPETDAYQPSTGKQKITIGVGC